MVGGFRFANIFISMQVIIYSKLRAFSFWVWATG